MSDGAPDNTSPRAAEDAFDNPPGSAGQAPQKDAAFEDAFRPTRLLAQETADLDVVSALFQDAILLLKETAWLQSERRFAFVANRYRWEEPDAHERVRTGAHFNGVSAVRARGVDFNAVDQPIVMLWIAFEPAPEAAPSGRVRIACAGGGEILLEVEALDAAMADLSRPWKARRTPRHPAGGAR